MRQFPHYLPNSLNFFRVCREHPDELARVIGLTPFSRAEYRLAYELATDPIERARRTVVRSHMGYGSNGIRRKLQSGFRAHGIQRGTTAAMDWAGLPPVIRATAERYAGVVVENRPALEIIDQQDTPETLFYLDPPYVHETRYDPTKGYEHEMTDADHEALAERIHRVKGMVVLSGYRSDLYSRLYAGWRHVEKNALGDGACKRVEVLWLNPSAQKALEGDSLL